MKDRKPEEKKANGGPDDRTAPISHGETAASPGKESGPLRGAPERIGRYRITGMLGRGGMGVVYEAEQEEPRRRVALKVIRGAAMRDEVSIRMFHREGESLARLKHPNIASIYEAGHTDEGEHFLAMELVEGELLHDYIDAVRRGKNRGCPPLDERLRLFRKICDAVNYAHQRGVIHRDLKPSNIKIPPSLDGEDRSIPGVKILDFGLARISDPDLAGDVMMSRAGEIKGTLPYMSPEQARGRPEEIDLRSDVYSLGVILYEMLSGDLPYRTEGTTLPEGIRIVCEEVPRPLRSLKIDGRPLDGDVETIVRKALQKDPGDRYPNAAALSEDIGRYLASLPIFARPPSAAYQVRKLVARHRKAFAVAVSGIVLVMAFGIWMSVLYARADANLRRALEAEKEAGGVSDFLVGLFEVSEPGEALGNSITAREILDDGAAKVRRELTDEPEVQARLMSTMGAVYRGLGLYEPAAELLGSSLDLRRELMGEDDPAVADSYHEMAALNTARGEYDEAEANFRTSIAIREKLFGADDLSVAAAVHDLGWLCLQQGKSDEADRLLARALALYEANPDKESQGLADCLNSRAELHRSRGELEEAAALLARVIAIRERELGENHPDLAANLNNLAVVRWYQGDFEKVEPLLERTLRIEEKTLGADHPDVAHSLVNLAMVHEKTGSYARAESLYLRSIDIRERALSPDHPDVAQALNNLGVLYGRMGRTGEAESVLRRALAVWREALGPEHPHVATALNNLGELYLNAGRYDEAEPLIEESAVLREKAFGGNHPGVALSLHNLGILRMRRGDREDAERLLRRSLEIRESTIGPVHERVAESFEALAELYRTMGRDADADEMEARAGEVRGLLDSQS